MYPVVERNHGKNSKRRQQEFSVYRSLAKFDYSLHFYFYERKSKQMRACVIVRHICYVLGIRMCCVGCFAYAHKNKNVNYNQISPNCDKYKILATFFSIVPMIPFYDSFHLSQCLKPIENVHMTSLRQHNSTTQFWWAENYMFRYDVEK